MEKTYCGADCANCGSKERCGGCREACGSPFGGMCIAAEYIKAGGRAAYEAFKAELLKELNGLLDSLQLPRAEVLYELPGSYINLEYPLPNGEKVKFLKDENIYLGCQIECDGLNFCCGAALDSTFILVCRYGENGSDPELVAYRHR